MKQLQAIKYEKGIELDIYKFQNISLHLLQENRGNTNNILSEEKN